MLAPAYQNLNIPTYLSGLILRCYMIQPHRRLLSIVGFHFVLIILISTSFTGCGGRSEVELGGVEDESNKMNSFQTAYFAFVEKKNRPPKSADELKSYYPDGVDPETVLVSTRDKQPYVVFWGADHRKQMGAKPLVIAYEKEGVNGSRMVFTGFGVMEMSDEQLQNGAVYPPGGSAPGADG